MFKNFSITVFMLLSVFSYGQKSTLLQNVNFRAKELQHSLSKDGDSLVLKSERTIYSVEIFNQDFEKTIQVGGNQTKIALNGTPIGRLVVQAKLIDKRILMTLLRHEAIETSVERKNKVIYRPKAIVVSEVKALNTITNKTTEFNNLPKVLTDFKIKFRATLPKPELQLTSTEQDDVVNTKNTDPIIIEGNNKQTDNRPERSLTNMLNWKPPTATSNNQKFYWIAEEINNGNSSHKIMKLVRGDVATEMISKNKIESKTKNGSRNKLTVWEVYDTAEFMKEQLGNPDYINSSSSNFFNVVPYFTTVFDRNNSSNP